MTDVVVSSGRAGTAPVQHRVEHPGRTVVRILPARLSSARRRRVAVIGSTPLHVLVRRAAPDDVAIVLAIGTRRALAEPEVVWDEAVIDVATLQLLRRERPDLLHAAPVHVLEDDADVAAARRLLRTPTSREGAAFKRGLDLTVALLVGLLVLPLLLLAALAIVLDSRGPAVFRQTRIGVGGVPFTIYKLRTMQQGNDDAAHREYCDALLRGTAPAFDGVFKLVADPRVTRVGRILRRLSLDELPQLWNVLRAEMSMVGPRPCLPTDLEHFSAEHWARLRVRPGLTGPWQVGGRCRLSYDQMLQLDVDYWQRWSPMTDVRILLRTPIAVLRGSGSV